MSAPLRNQFWRNRSKHGRDKLFASAPLLKEASEEYYNWNDAHPWYKVEALKGGLEAGKMIKIPSVRPYSLSGLCAYLGCSESYFRSFKSTATAKDEDFLTVIEEIENIIATQQFEGASVGAFNANIIARKLGLVDKTDITSNGRDVLSGQSDDDLKKLLQATLEKIDG